MQTSILDFSLLPERPFVDPELFLDDAADQPLQEDTLPSSAYNSPARSNRSGQLLERPCWYVLLLLDNNKSGHTNVIKTTEIQPWLEASSSTAAAVDSEGELSPASWRPAVIIEVGTDESLATRVIDMISINSKGKQVRGVVQRGARADLLATLMSKPYAIVWSAVLNLKPEEMELLTVRSYTL